MIFGESSQPDYFAVPVRLAVSAIDSPTRSPTMPLAPLISKSASPTLNSADTLTASPFHLRLKGIVISLVTP